MRIAEISPQPNWVLSVVAEDGRVGAFDVSPYLKDEAFEALKDPAEFLTVYNGGYFVEWDCGADLSAGTIEFRWGKLAKLPGAEADSFGHGFGRARSRPRKAAASRRTPKLPRLAARQQRIAH